mmetsp:Transcript_6539/g.9668  ORF Transcript_6539/g.9668 Transcript_6539/m.9668 type:complete len:170 (+) Transcript_6539:3-512(+)
MTLEEHGELRIVRKSTTTAPNTSSFNGESSNKQSSLLSLSGKLVNQMQPFIIEKTKGEGKSKFVFACVNEGGDEEDEKEKALIATMSEKLSVQDYVVRQVQDKKQKRNNKKIILKHEEQQHNESKIINVTNSNLGSVKAATTGPRIYMQDDDPEFDDLDEEDPDDDLDL